MNRFARLAPALASGLLLAACMPGSAVDAEIDDACAEIPFAAALPGDDAIAGRPLLWKQCGVAEVSARYGEEDPETGAGEHCTIDITDARFQTPESAAAIGAGGALEHGKSLILGFSKMNVEMLVEAREKTLAEPILLDIRGGPAHLPVVGGLSTGDPYVVPVPAKQQEPRSEVLQAVVNDRYAMTIECTDRVANHDAADALYRPYVAALRLGELP